MKFSLFLFISTFLISAQAEVKVPGTPDAASVTTTVIERQTFNVDVYMYGDINPLGSPNFYPYPKKASGFGATSRRPSNIEQMFCLRNGYGGAIGSAIEAVRYTSLMGQIILYQKTYPIYEVPRETTVETTAVKENADEFFADIKDQMLANFARNFGGFSQPKDLESFKEHIFIGHITKIACSRSTTK